MSSFTLYKPEAGLTSQVAIQPGQTYRFAFDPGMASYEGHNANVVILFDDGASLWLNDFLRVTAHDDFTIQFPDGTEISGRDIADMFNMALEDFHTDALATNSSLDDGIVLEEAAQAAQGLSLSGLLGDDDFAPLCLDVCVIPSHVHFDDDDDFGKNYFGITPHETGSAYPLTAPLSDSILPGQHLSDQHMAGQHMSGQNLAGRGLSEHDLSGHDLPGHDLSGHDSSGHDPAPGTVSAQLPELTPGHTPRQTGGQTKGQADGLTDGLTDGRPFLHPEGEPLQIEDMLDTSLPSLPESLTGPAFESLLDAQDYHVGLASDHDSALRYDPAFDHAACSSDRLLQSDGRETDFFLLQLIS